MKKFLFFPLLVFMTAFIVPACSNDDEDVFNPNDTISNDTVSDDSLHNNLPVVFKFNGELVVNGNYVKENTICGVREMDGEKFTMNIYKVKFAENMPVEIDITIPGISYNLKDGTFSGDTIVPLIGVAPAAAYTFSSIEGNMTDTTLTFSATLTRGTFSFTGRNAGK